MASILNRGNGSWRITVFNGYDSEGNQIKIYRTFHANPQSTVKSQRLQAEKYAAQLETDFSRKMITESKKVRFSQVVDEFLETRPMAESTKYWYRNLLDGRVLPVLGKTFVQDMTPRQIRSFFKKLNEEKAKPAKTNKAKKDRAQESQDTDTVKTAGNKKTFKSRSKTGKLSGTYQLHYYRAISAVLQFAVKSGYISVSPMNAIDPPRKDTKEAEFLEGDEVAKLVNAIDNLESPMWKAFFMLDLYSSCRPGELIALNWDDINIDEGIMSIRAGANYVKGKGTVRTDRPKTKSSMRLIALPQNVISVLKTWKTSQSAYKLQFGEAWPEPDAVFTGDLGHRLDINSPTQKWRKIQKKYNLKDVPLYALRHTGASLLIASGCDVKEVSGRLGHSRASTTLDVYTHLFEKAAQHTTDVLTAAIDSAVLKAKSKKKEA